MTASDNSIVMSDDLFCVCFYDSLFLYGSQRILTSIILVMI
jgi:hypothetical protein